MNPWEGISAPGPERRPLTHTEIEELLAAYSADEVGDEMERFEIEHHLLECATCQQAVKEIAQMRALLGTLALPTEKPSQPSTLRPSKQPSSLADAVLAQIKQEEHKMVVEPETMPDEVIGTFARPLLPFRGVVGVGRERDLPGQPGEANLYSLPSRPQESHIQRERGRSMKQISGDAPKRRVLPLRLATLMAAALVILVVGGSTAIVWTMAQHSKNGATPSSQLGSPHVGTTPTPTTPTTVNVRQQAHDLIQQFHAEVETWGAAHLYHDSYDGHDYRLDSAYMQAGIGGLLDDALARATSDADFQAVVEQANTALFNYHMFQAAYSDHTPSTSAHDSDLQLLNHYQLKGQVVIVSLAEQAMRVYQDGHLVKSFLVTTGRLERPSLPGVWHALLRQSPTTFKSAEPKSSPLWYPDTRINYAIEYHVAGYFIHDGWWRVDFGPGTQFPHKDAGGNQAFAGNGGMGGIQLSKENAGWLYQNTNLTTTFVVY